MAEREQKLIEFQKKHSVEKAAEVLKLFERLAKKGSKINLQLLKRNIVRNLAARNKSLEPDEKYWSMQLLIKLGLIPDPTDTSKKQRGGAL